MPAKTVAIADLRPTQMTLGMREVARRAGVVVALDQNGRQEYVARRPVPCVRGPAGSSGNGAAAALYPIDRHHMCRALLAAGITHVVPDVICDVARLGIEEFWRFMDLRSWVHPFDRDGERQPLNALPTAIAELVDDPFRALASEIRRGNGFVKDDTPFEEFIWADFLRRRVDRALLAKDFTRAAAHALALAQSGEAAHLPGWRGGADGGDSGYGKDRNNGRKRDR